MIVVREECLKLNRNGGNFWWSLHVMKNHKSHICREVTNFPFMRETLSCFVLVIPTYLFRSLQKAEEYSSRELEFCLIENVNLLLVTDTKGSLRWQGGCARTWSWASLWARYVLGWTAIPSLYQRKWWCVDHPFRESDCSKLNELMYYCSDRIFFLQANGHWRMYGL